MEKGSIRHANKTPMMHITKRFHFFPGDLESLGYLRREIRSILPDGVYGDLAYEVEVCCHELVMNALVHTASDVHVEVSAKLGSPDPWLKCSVKDRSPDLPSLRGACPTETSGRGLYIVEKVSDLWGVDAGKGGKTVWCTFKLDRVLCTPC